MTDEFYLIAITALLPLTAVMLVTQVNPYQALVMRGILGAIAALVYALFGAADVALTEALVGTMLSITLYAVAVRSSMEMRLGWVQPAEREDSPSPGNVSPSPEASGEAVAVSDIQPPPLDETLAATLRKVLKPHHLRLEIVPYPSREALQTALETKRVHTALWPSPHDDEADKRADAYRLQTRVKRLHNILSESLPASFSAVDYLDLAQASSPRVPLAQSSLSA